MDLRAFDPNEIARQFREDCFRKYKISIPEDDPLFLEVELMGALVEKSLQYYTSNIAMINRPLAQAADEYDKREAAKFDEFSRKCQELSGSIGKELASRFHDAMIMAINEASEAARAAAMTQIRGLLESQQRHASRFLAAGIAAQVAIVAAVTCALIFL